MNAPTSAPADWRSRYGFDQGMSPEAMNYWTVNGQNGNQAQHNVNNMPFVLNPSAGMLQNRDTAQQYMYQPAQAQGMDGDVPGRGMGGAAMGGDPLQQILGLIQQNPQLAQQLPALLQQGGMGAGMIPASAFMPGA